MKDTLYAVCFGLVVFFFVMFFNKLSKIYEARNNGMPLGYKTIEIDGHEYLVYDVFSKFGITHKANCKYCIENGDCND